MDGRYKIDTYRRMDELIDLKKISNKRSGYERVLREQGDRLSTRCMSFVDLESHEILRFLTE